MASICNLQIESVFDELLGGRRNIRSEWFNSPGMGYLTQWLLNAPSEFCRAPSFYENIQTAQ